MSQSIRMQRKMELHRQAKTTLFKGTAALMLPVFLSSCAAFHLADRAPQVNVSKLKQATKAVCGVAPFTYEPTDRGETKLMTAPDLARWHQMYFDAVNLADICAETVKVESATAIPKKVDYLIDGKISNFYFKKNWVPMLFPLHIGLSFITLTIYTWTAGPTTSTRVNFEFTTRLKDAKTGAIVATIPESFKSTDVMTVYSSDTNNPYGNPGIAFTPLINDSTTKLAEALQKAAPIKAEE